MMDLESLHAGGVVLSIQPWVVKMLHLVTLTTHVAVMNVLLGSALLYAVGLYMPRGNGMETPRLPVWMAFTINSGVAPLLFCQALLANYIYTSSILIAGWWLCVVGLLMAAYYLSYLATSSQAKAGAKRIAATTTALLLLFVSFVFVCNIDLMEHPDHWARYFESPHGWLLFTGGADTLFRWFHVVLAALFHALLLGRLLGKAGILNGRVGLWVGVSLVFFLFATGLVHYYLLPASVTRWAFSGVINIGLLMLSAFGLGVVYISGRLKFAAFWACGNLALMLCFRETIRNSLLMPATKWTLTDYSSFALFAVSLILGGGAVMYMLKLLRDGGDA